jgi:hypothetical protein
MKKTGMRLGYRMPVRLIVTREAKRMTSFEC